MSNWKKDLKETVEPSIDYSKCDLSVMIRQAEKKGACDEELYDLSQYDSIEEAMQHENAPYWCLWYAVYVIKKRWKEVEPIIMKDSEYAFWYAHDVIGGRWEEAEPFIMKNAGYACQYARYIIQGRWEEAEPIIVKKASSAYLYARHIFQKRWKEAESTIATSMLWKSEYEKIFNCKIGEE